MIYWLIFSAESWGICVAVGIGPCAGIVPEKTSLKIKLVTILPLASIVIGLLLIFATRHYSVALAQYSSIYGCPFNNDNNNEDTEDEERVVAPYADSEEGYRVQGTGPDGELHYVTVPKSVRGPSEESLRRALEEYERSQQMKKTALLSIGNRAGNRAPAIIVSQGVLLLCRPLVGSALLQAP